MTGHQARRPLVLLRLLLPLLPLLLPLLPLLLLLLPAVPAVVSCGCASACFRCGSEGHNAKWQAVGCPGCCMHMMIYAMPSMPAPVT